MLATCVKPRQPSKIYKSFLPALAHKASFFPVIFVEQGMGERNHKPRNKQRPMDESRSVSIQGSLLHQL